MQTDKPRSDKTIYAVNRCGADSEQHKHHNASTPAAGHFSQKFHVRLDTTKVRAVPTGLIRAKWRLSRNFRQAVRAISANFRARNRNLHIEVASDLLFQLFVQPALEFPNFAAAQARDVDVIARSMSLVVVPVAAQVQQI